MLTKKQKLFCRLYSLTRNSREAASLMGAKRPAEKGAQLLGDPAVRGEIERLCKRTPPQGETAQGLRRIAFGSISDAIRLLREWDTPLDLESLDLFSVSEIKFSKSGGMEIKFFDRIKALERLAALSDDANAEPSVAPFVEAVRKGADRLLPPTAEDENGF